MSHAARLAELGIELPHVAAPVAAYVPAVRTGDLVFTSGQLPTIAGEMIAHGLGVVGVPAHQVGLARGAGEHVISLHPHHGIGAAEARVASMTKWEYLTAPVLVHATKQILDNFGEDGWELVQMVPGMNPENLVAYFKRPRS